MKRVLVGCLLSVLIVILAASSFAATGIPFPDVNDTGRNYRSAEGFAIGDSVAFMIQSGSTGNYIPIGPAEIYDISNSTYTIYVDGKKCISALGWTFGELKTFSKSQSIENYNAISEVLYEKYPTFNKTDGIVYDVSYYNGLEAIYGNHWLKKESLYHSGYGLTIVHTLLDCGNNRYLHTVRFDKAEDGTLPVETTGSKSKEENDEWWEGIGDIGFDLEISFAP